MGGAYIATLGGVDLPAHFSYTPYIPRKRMSSTATAGAVITQIADPVIVHGDGTIAWEIAEGFASEFATMWALYDTNASNQIQTFTGYWGEELGVIFKVFDQPSVSGRLFQMSGQFQVISVTTPTTPTCGPPVPPAP